MDASLDVARLGAARRIESAGLLLAEEDFAGAEGVLLGGLEEAHRGPASDLAMLHYHLGRLYRRWNKLSSAIHHLHHAFDHTPTVSENWLQLQILEELNAVKKEQLRQRP